MKTQVVACNYHNGNKCKIKVYARDDLQDIITPYETCRLRYPTEQDMWADIYAHFVGAYYLVNSGVKKYSEFRKHHSTSFLTEYYTSRNSIRLMPLARYKNEPVVTTFEPNHDIRPVIDELFLEYIFRVTGVRHTLEDKGTLVSACIRALSWSKAIFDVTMVGDVPCRRVMYTTSDLPVTKVLNLYKQFGRNTTYRGTYTTRLMRLAPRVLKKLEFVLKTAAYRKSLEFKYSPKEMLKSLTLTKGGGILGMEMGADTEDLWHKDSGLKAFMIVAAFRLLHRMVHGYANNKPVAFTPLCVVRLKGEIKVFFNKVGEELLKAQNKAREFFIVCLVLTLISIIFIERMKIECGLVIKIGMKWWHGGAYEIAKQLNYDLPDMMWVDGDIDGYDKSILDLIFYMYMASMRYYYDTNKMSVRQRRVYEGLLKFLSYHLVNKVVLHVGSIWTILKGVMPSGAQETSHGDSWILAFYFYLFLMDVADKYPELSALIDKLIDMGIIAIIVYGDDHIWCVPRILWGVINLETWTKFLKNFCKSDLRDGKYYTSFLTEINPQTCQIIKPGPVFLKRYFIANLKNDNRAKVLPFRPLTEQILKMLSSEKHEPMDYVVSAIGFAHDTMNTNEVAYDLVKQFYRNFKNNNAKSYKDLMKEYQFNPTMTLKLTELVKKMGSEPENIYDCFPSRSYLNSMHVYDAQKLKFGGREDFQIYEELI
jgi:hypothetical protein